MSKYVFVVGMSAGADYLRYSMCGSTCDVWQHVRCVAALEAAPFGIVERDMLRAIQHYMLQGSQMDC